MRTHSFAIRIVAFVVLLVLTAVAQDGSLAAQAGGWVLLGPEGGDARSLAYDPNDPNRVFLGTSDGELYLSADGGARWTRFAHLGGRNDYVLDHVVIDPRDSRTIYAAAWSVENKGGDLFRSRDGGVTWQTLPGMHGKSIRAFSVAPSDARILVTGALDGVFRSRDGGETWEQISPPNHAEIKNIESVAVDPRNPDVIYAGTWHLPWKTNDGGRSWHSVKNGVVDDSDVFSIIVDPVNPSVVYASACSGIYKSENAGELFHKVQGIPFSARRTRVLQQDPSNPLTVYAGTTEGLWKSSDAGKTWKRMTATNVIVNDVMVDARRPSRVLLATDRGGVLASNDGAQSFADANRGFSHRQVTAVIVDQRNPNAMYAGVVNDKEFGGVFATRDGGSHWQQFNAGLNGDDVFALAQDESGDLLAGTNDGPRVYDSTQARWRASNAIVNEKITTVAQRIGNSKKKRMVRRRELIRGELRGRVAQVAVAPGRRWLAAGAGGVYVSQNQGRTWQGGRVDGQENFVSLAVSGEKVAAATTSGLWVSGDGAKTWNAIPVPPFVTRIYRVALEPTRVWITTHEGGFYSADGGQSWTHILVGSPAIQPATAIAYDAVGGRVLAVTPEGEVFSTSDGAQTWTRVGQPARGLRTISAAGGRLLGITHFGGIIAIPGTQARDRRSGAASDSAQ